MEGKYVTDARVGTDAYTGEFNVSMNMNSEGAKKWANVTRENVNQAIAIVLDGLVYSAPNVSEEIKGGSSSISGDFSQTDADPGQFRNRRFSARGQRADQWLYVPHPDRHHQHRP